MTSYDKIMHIFDEELKLRISEIVNEYAEIVSKKHGISLDLLLRDVPDVYTGLTCKGTKSDGHRCTFKGLHEGYCGKHVSQGRIIRQRDISSMNSHTHGPERVLFQIVQLVFVQMYLEI